jgi:tripartite-type tricarboxylate transporter receptor subunit TctC
MTYPRSKIVASSAVLGALFALSACFGVTSRADAQSYPTRPVTIIVPASAGGGIDFTARLFAQELQAALGKPFLVENRGGASGNIGMTAAMRAAPDGYTLVLAISGFMVTNPALFTSLTWDPVRNFSGVAMLLRAPHVLVVNNEFPANTLAELIAYAKANPGKLDYASPGVGTQNQIAAENLAQVAGIEISPVQYRGTGAALTDVITGTVNVFINTTQSMVGPIQGRQVKALALLSPNRLSMLPDVPTAREQGYPQIEIDTWYGLYAPVGTPKAIIDLLANELKKITEREDVKERVRQSGSEMLYKGPEETDRFTKEQLAYWTGIINKLGIKVQ